MNEVQTTPAHNNDVIFSEAGLNKFISLITKNPDMVKEVRIATAEEIAQHNSNHTTLEEGKIPGKGLAILWADGTMALLPVGSNINVPQFIDIQNNSDINNGTITFKVDESLMTIPVKGIIKDWEGNYADTEDSEALMIPNREAIKNYAAAKPVRYIVTAGKDNWDKGSIAPYEQKIDLSEIYAIDEPSGVDVIISGDNYTEDYERDKQWGNIYKVTTYDHYIMIYAHKKPTIDLPIRIEVIR